MRYISTWRSAGIGFLIIFMMVLGLSVKAEAAFPVDLDKKPLKATALTEDVEIYADSAMTEKKMEVSGGRFIFEATEVSDNQKALSGTCEIAGEKKDGWVSSSVFLKDDSFRHVYATVRAKMTIYTDSDLSERQATIKKYSGIIAVGKTDSAVQVIYQGKKCYGIGWLSAEDYENKLVYDGRDKQILADGIYNFESLDHLQTGLAFSSDQSSFRFRLEYVTKGRYHILNPDREEYLKLEETPMKDDSAKEEKPEWMDSGIMHVVKVFLSASYREKLNQWEEEQRKIAEEKETLEARIALGEVYEDTENKVRYELLWTDEAEEAGSFYLKREGEYFSFTWQETDLYCGRGEDQKREPILILTKMENENCLWKVRASENQVDPKNPMVFTQYDPQWCGKAYGSEGSMGTAGCGVLATVNAVYALTGQYMDVMELADYAVETGLRIVGSGTDDRIFKAAAKKYGSRYGFAYDGKSGNIETLKKKLQEGDVAMVHVIGHYVAITAYDAKKDKYLLLDSNCLPKRETTAFGDWITPGRLLDGYLYGQMYFFYKLAEE